MSDLLTELSWPASRLGEALEAAGRHCGLGVPGPAPPGLALPVSGTDEEPFGPWLEAAAGALGFEAEAVEAMYPEVERLLARAGPALLRLSGEGGPRFVILTGGQRKGVAVLSPALAVVPVAVRVLRDALCGAVEAPVLAEVEPILVQAAIPGKRRPRVREALLRERLGEARISGCWLLRPAGGAGFAVQARQAGLPLRLGGLLAVHALEYALWILSWWLLGWMALRGRFEPGWLLAWQLLLWSLVPLHVLATGLEGSLALRAGAVLKQRLLFGALKLDPDAIRHQGTGQLLGRVLEAEVIESMALTGGFLGLTALVELILAGAVLAAGAGGWAHVALLLAMLLATLLLGVRFYRRRRGWTEVRSSMTNDLVERMVGHRTRLAQQARAHWNDGEDEALEHYLSQSRDLDRTGARLQVLVPRGWFLAGLLAPAPAFLTGSRSTTALAVGLGGVLLAYSALRRLVDGLERLTAAGVAWERVAPFWQAGARSEPVGDLRLAGAVVGPRPPACLDHRLLHARDLVFRYPNRSGPVLHGISLHIEAGDRLLLEGPSGGGKSTLAALLAGSRVPEAGLALLDGLDRPTLGAERWRRRVVLAPQFHDNHVFMGTLAFNLLLGRGWRPRPADLEEAERVCRALDLGALLDRMPAGLLQLVGETGWQLSHGEKSRLYIARALLQGADLLLLDESFAALDPQTLQRTLAFVLEQAPTVLVIAHP